MSGDGNPRTLMKGPATADLNGKNGQEDAQEIPPIQLSDEVRGQIAPLLAAGEELKVGVETDMVLPGSFGTSWLVGTNRRICVFSPNGAGPTCKVDLPLDNTASLVRRDGLGSSLLEARTVEGSVPLVRFTEARSDAVDAAQEALKELLPHPEEEAGEDEYGGEKAERERRSKAKPCPKCSNPMPRWMSVCPDCLDKRQLILRLLQRSQLYWKPILYIFALTAFLRFCAIYPAELQRDLIDRALHLNVRTPQMVQVHMEMLWKIIAILALVRILSVFVGAVQQFVSTWLGEKVTNDLRLDLYIHLQKLGVNYYDQKETGWIMDRVTGDTATLQGL